MSTLQLPKLPANPTREQAKTWYEDVVWEFGPGFHPDTPAADYVRSDGVPTFSPEEAVQFDRDLETVWHLVGTGHEDIYDVGHYLMWRQQHGLPKREDRSDPRVILAHWLQWMDKNGSYTDRNAFLEGAAPMTMEEAIANKERMLVEGAESSK